MVKEKTNLPNLERAKKETEEFSEEMRLKVEKAKNMDINELKGSVLQRFQELTEEEKGIFDSIIDSPVGEIINKILGPALSQILSEPTSETDRMLADRTVGEPPSKDMPREMYERAPIEDDYKPPMHMLMDDPQRDIMPQAPIGSLEGRSQGGNELPPVRRRDPSLLQDRKGEREMASR